MALTTFSAGDTDYVDKLNTLAIQADDNETTLDNIAAGGAFSGTSTTSLTIATGSKAFTVAESNRAWTIGTSLRATSAANAANYMQGTVTAYSGTALTLDVTSIGGSGTLADWSIGVAAAGGIANLLEDTTPQLGGALDCNGKTLNKSSVRQITDASLGTGTHTFNYANGDMQQLTATGSITIAFSGMPSGQVCGFIIDAVNWGSYTITLPAGMLFTGGNAPVFTASGTDRLVVIKDKDDVYALTVVNEGLST